MNTVMKSRYVCLVISMLLIGVGCSNRYTSNQSSLNVKYDYVVDTEKILQVEKDLKAKNPNAKVFWVKLPRKKVIKK